MSTKAIRKALLDLQCDYNPCLPGLCRKHEALAEVGAIEEAAKEWVSGVENPSRSAWATDVAESIAKEAE